MQTPHTVRKALYRLAGHRAGRRRNRLIAPPRDDMQREFTSTEAVAHFDLEAQDVTAGLA